MMKRMILLCILSTWAWSPCSGAEAAPAGTVVEAQLVSRHLQGNLIGIDPERTIKVYLPPGYDHGNKAYPVIYYFHSLFWSNQRMFEDGGVQALFDRAIRAGTIRDFVLVAADFTTPHVGTFFGNSPQTGRWLDFIVEELVPFIDARFRTLPTRRSRGLAGDFLGGYAALKLAMLYPEQFSAVYALHPVGTGTGLIPMVSRPDWRKMNLARSWADLADDSLSQVFMAMAQAYLPNPTHPPFYCDLIVELNEGSLALNTDRAGKLQSRFLLDRLVPEYAANLKKLSAIQFDWGRYDVNQDHVYSNQAFTRKLDEYGVEHFAEEYRGNHWEQNWIEHGRVQDHLLPFFARFLDFERTP
jgi:enterochelin esterase-like enzyme